MADDRGAARDYPAWKPKPTSWTKLFSTFLVALDPFKLLVAAAGILATALGWWLISIIFFYSWTVPKLSDYDSRAFSSVAEEDRPKKREEAYQKDMATWAMMYELAGPSDPTTANADAKTAYTNWYQARNPNKARWNADLALGYGGKYRTMPWHEDRGPNPFLLTKSLVTGSAGERREFLGWFLGNQVPNLVEPLLKFLSPVSYLFDQRANVWVHLYLLLLIVWLLVVWGFFGGVITRMAVLQLTGKEGGGIREAVGFVKNRYLAYLLSPMVPLLLIGFMVLCCILFGVIHWIPLIGDLVDGLFWFLPLLAGLAIALLLLGMVGYPMMYPTLSAEGSDTFDAMSRSYNYVYESPWHYIWYSLVAIAYGAVLTLAVVTVGSAAAYLSKWGVAKWPTFGADRSPEYLFIYTPTSLGWREVMTQNSPVAVDAYNQPLDKVAYDKWMSEYAWYNHMGAGMASFWVSLVFMMVIGFGYSYFWTAATQVYLLMRKRVDETDYDEVYVEEDLPPTSPVTANPTPSLSPAPASLTPTPTTSAPAGTISTPVPIPAGSTVTVTSSAPAHIAAVPAPAAAPEPVTPVAPEPEPPAPDKPVI